MAGSRHSRFGSGIAALRPRKQALESGPATVDDRFNVTAVETLHLAPEESGPLEPTELAECGNGRFRNCERSQNVSAVCGCRLRARCRSHDVPAQPSGGTLRVA